MNATDLLKLLLAIATYESGDQKNISTIGSNTYNSTSGASGMFQILPGQDYLGEDGQRHSIPDNYAANDRQNTIAAIDLLRGKSESRMAISGRASSITAKIRMNT